MVNVRFITNLIAAPHKNAQAASVSFVVAIRFACKVIAPHALKKKTAIFKKVFQHFQQRRMHQNNSTLTLYFQVQHKNAEMTSSVSIIAAETKAGGKIYTLPIALLQNRRWDTTKKQA